MTESRVLTFRLQRTFIFAYKGANPVRVAISVCYLADTKDL